MFLVLGASLAGLVALLILPAVSRRASRLARADVERQLPLSPREIIGQRDLLRAEFATERRRLEQALEASNEAHARERGESGRRAGEIVRLTHTLAETASARDTAETAQAAAERRMRETDGENAALQKALHDVQENEVRLREHVSHLTRTTAGLDDDLAAAHAALAAFETAQAAAAARMDEVERALMQSRLDLSVAGTQRELQGAQIDALEERGRMASAAEQVLRQRIAALEAAASGGDLDMLRHAIVEIGREVVRLAHDAHATSLAHVERRSPADVS